MYHPHPRVQFNFKEDSPLWRYLVTCVPLLVPCQSGITRATYSVQVRLLAVLERHRTILLGWRLNRRLGNWKDRLERSEASLSRLNRTQEAVVCGSIWKVIWNNVIVWRRVIIWDIAWCFSSENRNPFSIRITNNRGALLSSIQSPIATPLWLLLLRMSSHSQAEWAETISFSFTLRRRGWRNRRFPVSNLVPKNNCKFKLFQFAYENAHGTSFRTSHPGESVSRADRPTDPLECLQDPLIQPN